MEPNAKGQQNDVDRPSPTGCHTFISAAVEGLTSLSFQLSPRKHLKMSGIPSVVPGTRFHESHGFPLVNWAVRGTVTVILVAMAFALGAWGGREYERREAERAGAGRYEDGQFRYIDGRSAAEYRAVAPHLTEK